MQSGRFLRFASPDSLVQISMCLRMCRCRRTFAFPGKDCRRISMDCAMMWAWEFSDSFSENQWQNQQSQWQNQCFSSNFQNIPCMNYGTSSILFIGLLLFVMDERKSAKRAQNARGLRPAGFEGTRACLAVFCPGAPGRDLARSRDRRMKRGAYVQNLLGGRGQLVPLCPPPGAPVGAPGLPADRLQLRPGARARRSSACSRTWSLRRSSCRPCPAWS